MRSVVTSGALVVALVASFASHVAFAAEAAEAAEAKGSEHTHRVAPAPSKGHKDTKPSRSKKKSHAKTDAASAEATTEAKPDKKADAKADKKADTKSAAKDASRGKDDDDDAELLQGIDPKIAAEDAREIAEEKAERERTLAAAKALREKTAKGGKTKSAVVVAKLALPPKKDASKDVPGAAVDHEEEQVHVETTVAALVPAPSAPIAKDLATASTHDVGPIAGKLVKASTHGKHVAPKPPCLHQSVEIVSHLNENDSFPLTRCDGSLAPAALERLSIAARPGSAPRPEVPAVDLAKIKGENFAPGVRRMDPTLVERLQLVVDHFSKSGKAPRVQVISGYRPSSVGSYHASGRALDFRLEGVRNEELVAFCKTLTDTGCGYYPNSVFIHMDVRDSGAGHVTWVDASGPGEKPHYVSSWPAPPSEMNRTKPAEEGLAKLDPMLPSLPSDEHPTLPIAAPQTWGGAKEGTTDLGARAGGIEGLQDDETP